MEILPQPNCVNLWQMFSRSFRGIYEQQERLFDSKPFNRTKALDFLCRLIIRKDKKNKNKQDEK